MIAKGTATIRKHLVLALKIAITSACFWYVFRQINVNDLISEGKALDFRWLALATIVMMVQIPLVGLRWARITNTLEPDSPPAPLRALLAITAITNFFAQILPNVMSDALRVWLLSQIKSSWHKGLAAVLIDRGVAVAALLTIGLVVLLNRSPFTALAGYRQVIVAIFSTLLIGGVASLVFAQFYAELLSHHRATKWIGDFALASRRVLIESPAAFSIVALAFIVHFLSITGIWSLGEAFSMSLSVTEASVLFTLMISVAIVPISIGGWGLRELAVTAFLNAHGLPSQRAFLFSLCFGLTLVAASLPGVVVLLFYSPDKARDHLALTS